MMDPLETGGSVSDLPRRRPYDRVVRWRLRLGIILVAYGVGALILLATAGDASFWGTLSAILSIALGLTGAISGWRDLHDGSDSPGGQPRS